VRVEKQLGGTLLRCINIYADLVRKWTWKLIRASCGITRVVAMLGGARNKEKVQVYHTSAQPNATWHILICAPESGPSGLNQCRGAGMHPLQ